MNISYQKALLLIANIEYIAGDFFRRINEDTTTLYGDYFEHNLSHQTIRDIEAFAQYRMLQLTAFLNMFRETLLTLKALLKSIYISAENNGCECPDPALAHIVETIYLPFLKEQQKLLWYRDRTILCDFYQQNMNRIDVTVGKYPIALTAQYEIFNTLKQIQDHAQETGIAISQAMRTSSAYLKEEKMIINYPIIAPKLDPTLITFFIDTIEQNIHILTNHAQKYLSQLHTIYKESILYWKNMNDPKISDDEDKISDTSSVDSTSECSAESFFGTASQMTSLDGMEAQSSGESSLFIEEPTCS